MNELTRIVGLIILCVSSVSLADPGSVPLNSPPGKVCDGCEDNIHWYQQETLKAERWREDPPTLPEPLVCNSEDYTRSCNGYELAPSRELYSFPGLVYVMIYIEVDDRINNPWRFALKQVREASQTFQRSGVPVQFIVAGIETVDNGNLGMQGILNSLRYRAGEISRRTGADLVVGLLPSFWGYWSHCGLANVGRGNAFPGTSVTACYDRYTFAHELGHNFGLMHDAGGPSPFVETGRGYIAPSGKGTIMAYADRRVPFFSSPKLSLKGEIFGTDEQDAVTALNEALGNVAMAHENYMKRYEEGTAMDVGGQTLSCH